MQQQARHDFSDLDLMLMRNGWPVADPSAWQRINRQRRVYAWQQFCGYLAPRLERIAHWLAAQAETKVARPA